MPCKGPMPIPAPVTCACGYFYTSAEEDPITVDVGEAIPFKDPGFYGPHALIYCPDDDPQTLRFRQGGVYMVSILLQVIPNGLPTFFSIDMAECQGMPSTRLGTFYQLPPDGFFKSQAIIIAIEGSELQVINHSDHPIQLAPYTAIDDDAACPVVASLLIVKLCDCMPVAPCFPQ